MLVVLGLALLGLTLYASTLSYALREYSRAQLAEKLSTEGERRWLDWLEIHKAELRSLTSLARVAANLAVFVFVAVWYLREAEPPIGTTDLLVPSAIALVLLMIFATGIPNALALYAAEGVLARSLYVLAALRIGLWPLARLLAGIDFVVRRLLGQPEEDEEQETERMEQEILDAVTEGEMHGAVDEEQKEIIRSVFELPDTTVSAIMTPRTDIDAVSADASFDEVRDMIRKAGHSRIPIYEKSLDHIVGVLYAKDLIGLRPDGPFDVRKLMRPVRFVPQTKNIADLLSELRQSKVHIAIVLDEYGGTAGLVTIEDILEELVGEIDDEYDRPEPPPIRRIDEDTLEVDGRVHVYEINQELKVELPEEGDYETISGFVFTTMGKIPSPGEVLTHENLHIEVLDADARKINRLRVRAVRQPQPT